MRNSRRLFIVVAFGAVLVLGAALALSLSYPTLPAHAQSATDTPTAAAGLRTVLTTTPSSTTEAMTGTTPTAASTATVTATATSALTGTAATWPVTPTLPASVTRSITVVGDGIVNLQPDTAQAVVGVEVVSDTIRAATAQVSTTMAALLTALQAQGLQAKDIQTSGYSISMERNPGPQTGAGAAAQVTTYRVSNNVTIIIRDISKVGSVLDAAVNAGANNVYGVNFSVNDQAAAEGQAYTKAMNDALSRAQFLAGLAGAQVGPVISISEITGQTPIALKSAAVMGMGGGAGPIAPGELQVERQVQVTFSLR